MANSSHFGIGLCLVGDKATVTRSIDFHCGASGEDCELNSQIALQCPLYAIADSLDELVCAGEQRLRHGETQRLRSFEIYHQLVFGRELHWERGGFRTAQDAIDIGGSAAELIGKVYPV